MSLLKKIIDYWGNRTQPKSTPTTRINNNAMRNRTTYLFNRQHGESACVFILPLKFTQICRVSYGYFVIIITDERNRSLMWSLGALWNRSLWHYHGMTSQYIAIWRHYTKNSSTIFFAKTLDPIPHKLVSFENFGQHKINQINAIYQ